MTISVEDTKGNQYERSGDAFVVPLGERWLARTTDTSIRSLFLGSSRGYSSLTKIGSEFVPNPRLFDWDSAGDLHLYTDIFATAPAAVVRIVPDQAKWSAADFSIILRDLRELAADPRSFFHFVNSTDFFSAEPWEVDRSRKMESLRKRAETVSLFLKRYLTAADDITRRNAIEVRSMRALATRKWALQHGKPADLVRQPISKPIVSTTLREFAADDAQGFLSSLGFRAYHTARSVLEEIGRLDPSFIDACSTDALEMKPELAHGSQGMLNIGSSISSFLSLATVKRDLEKSLDVLTERLSRGGSAALVQSTSNQVLLDPRFHHLRRLWEEQEMIGVSCATYAQPLAGLENVPISKGSTLYERWVTCQILIGFLQRGFEIASHSPSLFEMLRVGPSGVSISPDYYAMPLELTRNDLPQVVNVFLWQEPKVTRLNNGIKILPDETSEGYMRPDLYMKVCQGPSSSDFLVDYKFKNYGVNRGAKFYRQDLESLSLRYVDFLKPEACWIIHPNPQHKFFFTSNFQSNEFTAEVNLLRDAKKLRVLPLEVCRSPKAHLLPLFLSLLGVSSSLIHHCWSCGHAGTDTGNGFFQCADCSCAWHTKKCEHCTKPLITTFGIGIEFASLPVHLRSKDRMLFFDCPCGLSKRSESSDRSRRNIALAVRNLVPR